MTALAMPLAQSISPRPESAGLGTFRHFVRALQAADLVNLVEGRGPVTVFAIPDAAFQPVAGNPESAISGDHKQLGTLVRRHVVRGSAGFAQVREHGPVRLTTLGRQVLRLEVRRGECFVNGVRVLHADIPAANGMIHVVEAAIPARA